MSPSTGARGAGHASFWEGSEPSPHSELPRHLEAGSYVRLIDFVYHPTLGSRVIKKKKKKYLLAKSREYPEGQRVSLRYCLPCQLMSLRYCPPRASVCPCVVAYRKVLRAWLLIAPETVILPSDEVPEGCKARIVLGRCGTLGARFPVEGDRCVVSS